MSQRAQSLSNLQRIWNPSGKIDKSSGGSSCDGVVSKGTTLAAAVIVSLLVGIAVGYLYQTGQVSSLQSQLSKANENSIMLRAEMLNQTTPIAFKAESGQMVHDAWLLVSPAGNGRYVVAVHAEGLDHTSAQGAYLVEGVTKTAMKMVPLGANISLSEFEAGSNGIGQYSVIINLNPNVTFEKIEILFLPGMSMERAVLVATATLG